MGGFPALMIKPPESPVQEIGGALAIKGGIQEQQIRAQQEQMGEISLQQARQMQESNSTLMDAFARNKGDFNQTYADAANSGKVLPQVLMDFRTKSIAMQTQAAQLTKDQLENLGKMHDLAANEIESVKQLPVEQRTQGIKDALGRMASQGVDISKIVPSLAGLPDFSDASLNRVETGLKGDQWVLANEKAQREARQAPTDAQAEAQRVATLTKTVAEGNKAAADASLALEHKRILGQVTPEDVYKEQQENYRASLARQATFANNLQKNGLEQLDKMFADPQHGYTQFIAQAQSTKNTIMQSRNGSELASSMEPLMLALGVTSFAGIHRINETEVNAAGPGAGSLYRKLNTILDKAGSGKVPEDTLKEAGAIVDGLIDAKHSAIINGANMVAANGGLDPKKTMVMDRSGVITTLDKAAEGNVRHQETPAQNPATAIPGNVSKALSSVGAGRHTLSDGSVWDKHADGTIEKAQ